VGGSEGSCLGFPEPPCPGRRVTDSPDTLAGGAPHLSVPDPCPVLSFPACAFVLLAEVSPVVGFSPVQNA
jgi:hypothetical protein